jgi:hypothetical protein
MNNLWILKEDTKIVDDILQAITKSDFSKEEKEKLYNIMKG